VNTPRTVTAGRAARWLLLACTLLGLAAMHTLGHAGMRMDAGRHGVPMAVAPVAVPPVAVPPVAVPPVAVAPVAAAPVAAAPVAVVPPAVAAEDCPAGHCDGHGDGGMSGWSVCLAVLGGLAVIVLLAALLFRAASGRRLRRRPVPVSAPARAPPKRPARLSTASVAVLRI
jgi:hypothetical protein